MSKKDKIAIFFGDMTEEGQKKVVAQGLAEIGDFSGMTPDEIEVESVTVEPEAYGYDQDPEKQELLEHVHAETPDACYLMVWDCFDHEFQTIMEE